MAGGVVRKKQQRPRKTAIRWPHKPEIPGSTPGAATTKKPAQRGFFAVQPMNTANQVKAALREAARDRPYAEYGESWRDHDPGGFWGEGTEEERRLMALVAEAKTNKSPCQH